MNIFLLVAAVFSQCTNPAVRKEWRNLSDSERANYLKAVTALKARQPGDSPANWNYDQFAKTHWDFQTNNHNTPFFFPWHREFIHAFESALKSIDSSVSLPYWDWTLDSQRPELSPVFADSAFGRNGDATTKCLKTGVGAGWIGAAPDGKNCVKRCNAFGTLFSPEAVTALISRATTFAKLADSIENGPHALVHNQVGGDCGDFSTMASANDPLFFLHHAMVDKIWWKWQTGCVDFRSTFSSNPQTTLPPFSAVVADTFGTADGRFCYTYDGSTGDLPLSLNCPTKNPVTSSTRTTTTAAVATSAAPQATSVVNASPVPTTTVTGVAITSTSVSPTATSTSTAVPTTAVDEYWFEIMIQKLLPGADSIKATKQHNSFAHVAKRSVMHSHLGNGTSTRYYFKAFYRVVAPPNEDIQDTVHLRFPTEADDKFLENMMIDKENYFETLEYAKLVVDEYNNKQDYVSPAALKHTYNTNYYRQKFYAAEFGNSTLS